MKQEDATTLRIGDDFRKACAAFEAYLDRLCIHGECRTPCGIWDSEKRRCSLKHQVRLMHRAPRNYADGDPTEKEDRMILSLLEEIYRSIGAEAALNRACEGAKRHVQPCLSRN